MVCITCFSLMLFLTGSNHCILISRSTLSNQQLSNFKNLPIMWSLFIWKLFNKLAISNSLVFVVKKKKVGNILQRIKRNRTSIRKKINVSWKYFTWKIKHFWKILYSFAWSVGMVVFCQASASACIKFIF